MIDNQISVETPENIELQLIPAGPVPRILAYSFDLCIRTIILLLLGWLLALLNDVGIAFYLVAYFILDWFYSVLFEMLNDGATPGKSLFKLQVIHDDGTPLVWGSSVLRNVLRAIDFFPFAYLLGIISMIASNRFKRLGDHGAGTLVVYRPTVLTKPILSEVGSRPAPFLLELDEQQAILAFAERSNRLSTARQQELAEILQPLFRDKGDPITQIKQIANGIIGQS